MAAAAVTERTQCPLLAVLYMRRHLKTQFGGINFQDSTEGSVTQDAFTVIPSLTV